LPHKAKKNLYLPVKRKSELLLPVICHGLTGQKQPVSFVEVFTGLWLFMFYLVSEFFLTLFFIADVKSG
jgi:hypothetical protein